MTMRFEEWWMENEFSPMIYGEMEVAYNAGRESAQQERKPDAWARRWHIDGEKPAKVKNENGRWAWPGKFKFLPVSAGRCMADDVALYRAAQQERKPDDNARLIAAAPDMLAACLAYMRDREEVGCVADSAAVKAMRAAIAKATKETPMPNTRVAQIVMDSYAEMNKAERAAQQERKPLHTEADVQQLVGIASAYRQEFCSTAEVEAEVRAVLGVPAP